MPRIAVISSRQLFLGRDDSQIAKPTDQGSYDYYHRYQEPRPVLQLLPEASLPSCFTSLSEAVFPDRSIVFDELAFSLSSSTFAPLKLSHGLHLLIIGSYLAYYRANHHRHRH